MALLPSLQILLIASFVDTALSVFASKTSYHSIFPPLILFFVILICQNLNRALSSFISTKLRMESGNEYRTALLEKRACLSYFHIENNDSWELITRVAERADNRVNNGFQLLLRMGDMILRTSSILLVLAAQAWWVAVITLVCSVPLYFIAIRSGQRTYKASQEAQKHKRRADYLMEVLTGREAAEERALFGFSSYLSSKWYERYEDARIITAKSEARRFVQMKGAGLIITMFSVLIAGILLQPLAAGTITIGMYIGLVTATTNLVQMMSWELGNVTSQLAAQREYLRDLTAFCSLEATDGALDAPRNQSDVIIETIEFENVSFRYPETEKYILKNLTLKLRKGQHYAFAGKNGAGKTTLIKLLTGLYKEFDGKIMINSKSIQEYTSSELKAMFSVIHQDFAKYQVTLYENLWLGDICGADDAAINAALEAVNLDDVKEALPLGINTPIGKIFPDGHELSGGQWQRVAIARALTGHMRGNSRMLILDEPTAALDPIAESRLYEMFADASHEQSAIFITHRLGAVHNADEIIVIDDGAVAEQGSHDELMEKGGLYSEMFEAQRSWYL